MQHHESGFLRIVVILVVLIGLLLFSGIDLQENINSENIQNTVMQIESQISDVYNTYLKNFMETVVIQPARDVWYYIDMYVVDVITDFLRSIYSQYSSNTH